MILKKNMESNGIRKKSYWKKERDKCDSPKKWIILNVEINDSKTISETFNNYFVTIGLNLASKISKSDTKI